MADEVDSMRRWLNSGDKAYKSRLFNRLLELRGTGRRGADLDNAVKKEFPEANNQTVKAARRYGNIVGAAEKASEGGKKIPKRLAPFVDRGREEIDTVGTDPRKGEARVWVASIDYIDPTTGREARELVRMRLLIGQGGGPEEDATRLRALAAALADKKASGQSMSAKAIFNAILGPGAKYSFRPEK